MPERICCNPEFLPFRLLRSARVAAMRFTDPDRYAAIAAIRAAGRTAALLARGANRGLLAAGEAEVYTLLQRSLAGKSRVSRHSLLPAAADIFLRVKNVVSAMHDCRRPRAGGPDVIAELLPGLLEEAASLLSCLELQLGAASVHGAQLYGNRFRQKEADLRALLRRARTGIPGLPAEARPLRAATVLTAFDELLASISRTAYAASKRVKRARR